MYHSDNNKTMLKESGVRIRGFLLILLSVFCLLLSVSFAQEEVVYDEEGRHDPFIALVTPDGRLLNLEPGEAEAKIVLEGIIYSKDGCSYAIINGEIVKVGDYILGNAVFKIEEDKVILMEDKKPVEYKLREEEL